MDEQADVAMTRYFVLDCHPGLDAEHYAHRVGEPARSRRWEAGVLFSDGDWREGFHLLRGVISIECVDEPEPPARTYAELHWVPIPLMSRRLVAALRAAGVDNLQTFETTLVDPPGASPPQRDHYLAVNVVGLVSAADLARSQSNPDVPDRMTSMDFHSLAIDRARALDLAMFRLAENVSAVLVHERIKAFLDSKGFDTLTWFEPEEWAG